MTGLSARWVLLLLGVLAVLLPGGVGQVLAGVPLSAAGLLAIAGVGYAAVALPKLGWGSARWLAVGLALVMGLKVAAAITAPPIGLRASYWAGATADGPAGALDRLCSGSPTRRASDASLDLRGEEFPVHFFNDAARFNFGADVQPGRDQLPFSVRWQGWLLSPVGRRAAFRARARADQRRSGSTTRTCRRRTRACTVSAGLHALRVEYARPGGARARGCGWLWQRVPGGALEPWVAPTCAGSRTRPRPWPSMACWGRVADVGLAALLLAWVAIGLAPGASARTAWCARRSALVPLLFLVHGMLLHAPLAGRATILSGLDDWLIYESSARDILLNGPLMDGGQGHAPPFYGQPLYPYVLALAHRLTGESLFGPLALQFAALGGVLVGHGGAGAARVRLAPGRPGCAGVPVAAAAARAEHFKVARQLFNENLYMPLVMASLIVLVGLARRRGRPRGGRLC